MNCRFLFCDWRYFMKAIIYTSSAGHTKRYAEMLSEELNLPAYTLAEAKNAVKEGSPVIYMGWLRNAEVMGYDAAWRRYKVRALIAVGMSDALEAASKKLHDLYSTHYCPAAKFYLPGGFSNSAVRYPHKLMVPIMRVLYNSRFGEKMASQNENEAGMKRILNSEADLVSREHLSDFIKWYKS